jgi:hypothetical protein
MKHTFKYLAVLSLIVTSVHAQDLTSAVVVDPATNAPVPAPAPTPAPEVKAVSAPIVIADEKKSPVNIDVSVGRGGVSVGANKVQHIAGPVSLNMGGDVGIDLRKVNGTGESSNETYIRASVHLNGFAGLLIAPVDGLKIIPTMAYKCETQGQGCGPRAGGRVFIGKDGKVNFGLGYSRAIGDKDHGEKDSFDLYLRIPLTANDQDRFLNEKTDLDSAEKKQVKEKTNSSAKEA